MAARAGVAMSCVPARGMPLAAARAMRPVALRSPAATARGFGRVWAVPQLASNGTCSAVVTASSSTRSAVVAASSGKRSEAAGKADPAPAVQLLPACVWLLKLGLIAGCAAAGGLHLAALLAVLLLVVPWMWAAAAELTDHLTAMEVDDMCRERVSWPPCCRVLARDLP